MMPTNLTDAEVKDTFSQLLHVDGGPAAGEKTVYSAVGVATALKVGTGSISVDNVRLDGNTVSTLDTNGDLNLAPNGAGTVRVGNVTLAANTISTADTDGDLILSPNGSGTVNIASANITGGSIAGVSFSGSFTGITLIESQAFHTVNGGNGLEIENTGIVAGGVSTDIDISITPKGTGAVNLPKVNISGGSIDDTPIGSTTPRFVTGTVVRATTELGYATGAGGTVTQLTDKATTVSLNKHSGRITMSNATLNRNTGVTFTFNNTTIGPHDVVIVNIVSGATPSAYTVSVDSVGSGTCSIHLHNHTTGTDLSEAVVIGFAVITGVIS